jgi:SAM-dependent methyltransferase
MRDSAAKYFCSRKSGWTCAVTDPVRSSPWLSPTGVDLRTDGADGLPWRDASFDVVVSCNVFHYVSSPAPALREMSRVLAPGGKIVTTDWCDDCLACRLRRLYPRWGQRVAGPDDGDCDRRRHAFEMNGCAIMQPCTW